MPDLFQLFDGTMSAGGAASVSGQTETFSDVSSESELVSLMASGSDSVDLLVDYSDFANFVTFNSAESYVNVTADEILNSYPFGGTVAELQQFLESLDGYQRYFLGQWPSRTGHLRLNPSVSSSYVAFTDFGVQDGVGRSSFVSPGTGSLSIQCWLDMPTLTGSNDAQVVFQKLRDSSTDGVTLYASGSLVYFTVSSGSSTVTVSASLSSRPSFVAGVLDRTSPTGTVSLYVGATASFPILSDSANGTFGTRFDLSSGSFYIGSGSLAGKVVRPFTGSVDDVSVWSSVRDLPALTGTYNSKLYSQSGLLGAWRFNEATPATPPAYSSVVRDCSGHRIDGRIQRYFSGSRGSGSLSADSPDPILSLDDPDVVAYIVDAQASGSAYDRANQSLIFNLFPESFSVQDPSSADVFKNFALIIARHFDRIKLYINQLANLRRVTYGDFDQAPDELLEHVASWLGWDLGGNFSRTDALRYFVGKGVQAGPAGNVAIDTSIADIKAQVWRRSLLNLLYIYKTKGTRESVEALLRSQGVDSGFVRLKEYARKSETRMPTSRVVAEKSVYALQFVSGATVSFTAR